MKKVNNEEGIIDVITNYIKFQLGISEWSARWIVKEVIEKYKKLKN